jgi:uncharacterized alkaline shock family protein YloU
MHLQATILVSLRQEVFLVEGRLEAEKITADNDLGSIKIADEVVSIIAGLAASEIEGVAAMSGGWGANLGEILGRKNLAKGVKVEINENSAVIDVFVVVDFGFPIPRVASSVQQAVKQAVETMTGLVASLVNVHVMAVSTKKPGEAVEEVEA